VSIRITIKQKGSLQADMLSDLKTKLIDLHTAVVKKSPVDTGDFRAAWTVDTATLSLENNSDHAEAMDNGHSPQAPKGFVGDTAKDIFK
jgi:hypothetical protein